MRWTASAIGLLMSAVCLATVPSALINRQLDTQQNLKLDTTLPDAMEQIARQTGVRLEADTAVWDLLPWGDQTSIKATIQNHTLRQALTAITQKFALEFSLGEESVQLRPIPALRRLGQRANIDELGVLALMTATPIDLPGDQASLREIVAAESQKLSALKSNFAIDNRAPAAMQDQKISVPKNASLADALEDAAQQEDIAWFAAGKSIVILSNAEQIHRQLDKKITTHYPGVDVAQVLLELFHTAGVDYTVNPGAYKRIPAQYRSVQLMLDNASIQQALESIGGYTGLKFEVTGKGVHVNYAVDAAAVTQPAK